MNKDSITLDVININTSLAARGYEGSFILPLTYDVNITNELTDRAKAGKKYDEFVFRDLADNRYRARDLWLTNKNTDNYFSYEDRGTRVTGATIFNFRCNEFSQI